MPLPTPGQPWPPASLNTVLPQISTWAAWWSSDMPALARAYGSGHRPARPGLIDRLKRWFVATPTPAGETNTKLHVPVATDLCVMSSDLLFAKPPTFVFKTQATQQRFDRLAGEELWTTLAEAAEKAAAMTGVFIRVTWDETVTPDGPFITTIDADTVIPEYRWGRLVAATLWWVVRQENQIVWRHVERHELTPTGEGIILHGLYQGTDDQLGQRIPLEHHQATANLEPEVNTGPGLAILYFPNITPQRRWRSDPLGRNYGRSDLDGIEPLLDALDETMTSWMRDIRLGKARVFADKQLLTDLGPGQGAGFDLSQEIFTPLETLPGSVREHKPLLDQVQFQIRVEEHRETSKEILRHILRSAGYSSESFGEGQEGLMTATEVDSRTNRSELTRARKIRLWRPGLVALAEKLLTVDKLVFPHLAGQPERPDVRFADSAHDPMRALAQTAQMMHTAEAASTETRVRLIHPDWDEQQVQEEVGKIQDQSGPALPADLFRPTVDDG